MRWWLLLLVASCYRPALEESCSVRCDLSSGCPGAQVCDNGFCRAAGLACGGDGGIVDTPNDGPRDGQNDALACFGRGDAPFTRVCLDVAVDERMLTGALGTDDCTTVVTQAGGTDFCVIAGRTIMVGNVSFSGTRIPLLLATETLTVNGPISVAGMLTNAAGSSTCTGEPGAPATAGLGGGGGPGGSSGALGGDGGAGQDATSTLAPGTPPATIVRGGCAGGPGGASTETAAAGGRGGGSIYLMAGTTIHVVSEIDASGAGGDGGGLSGGGGGGGAGGMIVFDAASIILESSAAVFANGGGGGGAGSSATRGMPGNAPTSPAAGGTPGAGGNTAPSGGAGGIGPGSPGGHAAANTGDGGGGGGGSGGVIRMSPLVLTGNVSPQPY